MCSVVEHLSAEQQLERWRSYGIVGRLHWGDPTNGIVYQKSLSPKIEKAKRCLEDLHNLTSGQWYVSCSFGVDSWVVVHLAREIKADVPIVWINQGWLGEWADCLMLRSWAIAQNYNVQEVTPDIDITAWYRVHGVHFAQDMNNKTDKAQCEALLYTPLRRWVQNHQTRGYAWGLRGRDEGKHRQKLLGSKSLLFQRKNDDQWVCSPIGWWNKAEVFAYLDLNNLPYPAMYDRDRATVRNGCPLDGTAVNLGKFHRMQRLFPDVWRVLVVEFPELERFC
jgi:phosphoadenosine phosphosulfate reductase